VPFIRLSDNYIDNPKFLVLTDGAFRLWHEGMAYTRRHQTDGLIPFVAMRGFPSFTKGREKQLASPHSDGANPLWVLIPKTGYKIHDYLDWNPSRDEENERRAGTRDRMRQFRERRQEMKGAPGSSLQAGDAVTSAVTSAVTAHDVLDRERERKREVPEKGSGEKPAATLAADDLGERARWLLESYPRWYAAQRHGARIPLLLGNLPFQEALVLCETWDDARLEKLARIVLTTDDEPFIQRSDRGWKIFTLKASWADDRLRQWEREQAAKVSA
jgi:hypothetical protein